MTDEEYLATRPEMPKDEILERNVEYLGAYLFDIANPKATKYFTTERAKSLDTGLYTRCAGLLHEHALIDEAALAKLMCLLEETIELETNYAAETRIREIIFPDVK